MTKDAIIFEDRSVLVVGGAERRDFLQGLITNDMELLTPGQAIYAALLTPQGKFLFDFFIAEHDDHLLMDVEKARLPDLLKRLMMYRLRADVTLEDGTESWSVAAMLSLPGGLGDSPGTCQTLGNGVVFTDPRNPALGARALLPLTEAAATLEGAGYSLAAQESYDAQRIALGVPDYRDMEVEKTLALEGNLDLLNAVSFKKGCYVGQELTARTRYRGNVRRRLYPVTLGGDVAPGTEVMLGDKPAGDLRSVHGHRAIASLRIDDVAAAATNGPLKADGTIVTVDSTP